MNLTLRQVKSRIRSIENIRKITRAMEMVAVAKLRPLQNVLSAYREYHERLEGFLGNLIRGIDFTDHPLLIPHKKQQALTLCIIASDTGLCGSYNHNLFRAVRHFIEENADQRIELVVVGRKAENFFKRLNFPIIDSYTELYGRYSQAIIEKITENLCDMFLAKKTDQIYVAYTYVQSASRHSPRIEKFLAIEQPKGRPIGYLTEPDRKTILADLIPLYLMSRMKMMVLNSFTSEFSARAMTMGEATGNAKEVLSDLILTRNKVRQANITRELIEVISSADALKG